MTVPWGGNLRDTASLLRYIETIKSYIQLALKRYPNRPLVIVAHSWGSVASYQALKELETKLVSGKRVVDSGSVALFITMGSPLESSQPSLITSLLKLLPGVIPGQQYVDTTASKLVIRKPDAVGYWINYSVARDLVSSGTLDFADVNRNWLQKPFLSTFFSNPSTHQQYYTDFNNAFGEELDAEFILNNDCKNIFTINSGAPTAGFGASYNTQSTAKELLVKVTCYGGTSTNPPKSV